MKFAVALCLAISSAFLTGCDRWRIDECSWTEEIRFQQETKDWLGGLDWPRTAYGDFNKIGDHNELRERFCKS